MSGECVESLTISVINVRENGRRASFHNVERLKYERVRIDGCLINDGLRCDWLVRKVGEVSALVELKGADVAHGCKQLETTRTNPAVQPYLEKRTVFLIVSSRSPSFDTRVARAKENARKMGVKLTVKTREFAGRIESLC